MIATAVITPASEPPGLHIEHEGQVLIFNLSRFSRKPFEKADLFHCINAYWADQPMEIQNKIFNIYKEILMFYEDHYSREELTTFIAKKSCELLTYHDLTRVNDWLDFKYGPIIPTTFTRSYVDDIDSNKSRDKTYTQLDYKQLLSLSVALRCMVPIWGDYINIIKTDAGNEFKESYSYRLIHNTPIVLSHPMMKLKQYVGALTIDKHTPDNVLKGISSEDFVDWLLALVVVKRLCIANINPDENGANIITYIYKFIIQRIQARDSGFENSYREKKYDDKGPGGGENKISTLEKYKIKTSISPGEISEIEVSVRDSYLTATKLTAHITHEFLNRWIESSQTLLQYELQDCQLTLLGWVMKPVASHWGIPYLSKETTVNLIGVAQAVLWLRGHRYIALLLGSHAMTSDRSMVVSPVDSKMRPPKELLDQLMKVYPFTRAPTTKRRIEVKPTNIIIDSIDEITEIITMYSWKMTADIDFIKEELNSSSRKLLIRPDIKTYIAELVLQIGERSWI